MEDGDPPKLREIDVRGFRRRLGPILDVYAAAMDPPIDQLPGRYAIMERHTTYPRFRALVAESRRPFLRGGAIQGFAYGFHGTPGQWWHDVVHHALDEAGGAGHAAEWLSDSFEVAELHVDPAHQGRGLGRALLTTLCADRPERTVVLSTLDRRPETRARRLYRSVGMVDLLADFEFPGGGPRYAVMGARLPLTDSPHGPDDH
ncbi:Acetyltransferase (GNAT) family protein [Thermomonospora echinospora]|uniref:Acetyltransferase (GNAT) family protein n=1 Tax=Thermomonospora echinospora TaxID=1992 RepID=A0A1H5SBI1_9ACTN|nr:GNAT family N-acetyltransferase [Thermomonospora echinospora]SEF47966.1 Acetyltransferase (GNAT) family protein [Thermomonospora echinospora]